MRRRVYKAAAMAVMAGVMMAGIVPVQVVAQAQARVVAKRASLRTAAPVQAPAPVAAPVAADRYNTAPWWMKTTVIAQDGYVFSEVAANRAAFTASFLEVAPTVEKAQAQAIDKTRGLQQVLAGLGRDQVKITTSFAMRPLYQEYRDRDGNMREDRRGDKIRAYEVTLGVAIEVRDLSQLEQAYALVMAARPTSTTDIGYSLEPGNDLNSWLDREAVKDAHRRAGEAATAAGATLGAIQLIDPTGRACHSSILGPGPAPGGGYITAEDIGAFPDKSVAESLQRVEAYGVVGGAVASPPPPAPGSAAYLQQQALTTSFIQTPPMQRVEARACVVYELN